MKKIGKTLLLATACVWGSSQLAQAAGDLLVTSSGSVKDIPMGVPVPAPMPVGTNASWYIRGDIGYAMFSDVDGFFSNVGATTALTGGDVDENITFGIGAGRYFSRNLRGDITIDYRIDSDVDVGLPASAVTPNTFGGTNPNDYVFDGAELDQISVLSTIFLANLYFDLRPGSRFSPYVGGGIGFALHNANVGGDLTAVDDNDISFAGALMAGVNMSLGQGWFLDAGYRYLYLGDVNLTTTVALDDPATINATTTSDIDLDSLMSHEIRVGLRYDIY